MPVASKIVPARNGQRVFLPINSSQHVPIERLRLPVLPMQGGYGYSILRVAKMPEIAYSLRLLQVEKPRPDQKLTKTK